MLLAKEQKINVYPAATLESAATTTKSNYSMANLIRILLINSLFVICTFVGCVERKAETIWKQTKDFFLSDSCTIYNYKNRISEKAIKSIVNSDTSKQYEKVVIFFKDIEINKVIEHYTVKKDSIIYIDFDGGPSIGIELVNRLWVVSGIHFSK